MKGFFARLAGKLRQFMTGRYGNDELSYTMSVTGLVLLLLSYLFRPLWFFYPVGAFLIILSFFRSMSKNIYKRQGERRKFLSAVGAVKAKFVLIINRFRDRKTHIYYTCPKCRATVRIKKPGKGRTITVTCPRCGEKFDKKT